MLTPAELEQRTGPRRIRKARRPHSLQQRYQEYILQRIEDYKNSISRQELLGIGDDAMGELHSDPEGQLSLAEVLIQDAVDQLIKKRLRLPPFKRWRQKFVKLRQAQREPTHWNLERRGAVAAMLERLEPGDHAIVIGGGAEASVYLLAAHDIRLTCLFEDNATCSKIETRLAGEALTGDCDAYVVRLGAWFPPVDRPVQVGVLDAGILAELPAPRRLALLAWLQDLTAPGGLHAVMSRPGSTPAETWLSLYPDWERVRLKSESRGRSGGAKRSASTGVLLSRPVPATSGSQQASTA